MNIFSSFVDFGRFFSQLIKDGLNKTFFHIRSAGWLTFIYFFFTFLSFFVIVVSGFFSYTYLVLNDFVIHRATFFDTVLCFDAISIGLVFMTATIFPCCFLYVLNREDRHVWAIYLFCTEVLVLLAFLSSDLLFFFIIFELLIFPMYKLILG